MTPKFELTEMVEGQSGGEVLFNEALNKIEALAQLTIKDRDLSAPPGGESNGDIYIVNPTGTGDWAGQDDDIAIYYDGWIFITPYEGLVAYIEDEDEILPYRSGSWRSEGITDLNQTIAGPSIAEVQAISDKVDALLASLRNKGILDPATT